VENDMSENVSKVDDIQKCTSETESMTAGRVVEYVGKTYDWVQPRLEKYQAYTEDMPDARNHLRKNYPGWVVDILKAEADNLSTYPVITPEDISKHGMSQVIMRDEGWIDARLPYLGITGETKLNPVNNRLFEYYNKEVHVPLLLVESTRMRMYPVASADDGTVQTLANILSVDRKSIIRRLPYIDILPVVKMSGDVGQLYGYYPIKQTIEALGNLGKKSIRSKTPHHPSEPKEAGCNEVADRCDTKESTEDSCGLGEFIIEKSLQDRRYRTELPVVPATVDTANWADYALCKETDPDAFSDLVDQRRVAMAKKVCSECISRLFCLDYAVVNGEPDGIWGGLTPSERKKLKRET
jgi:WhiB family redox-sensing transcriptional regulator